MKQQRRVLLEKLQKFAQGKWVNNAMFVLICFHQISTHEHALCVDMHYKYYTYSYFIIWKLI
jgi:hypothetical protein